MASEAEGMARPTVARRGEARGPSTRSRVGHQMTVEPSWANDPTPLIARAEGCYFWDTRGRRVFDGNSGLQNVHIGHGHPEMSATAARQIGELDFFPLYSGSHVVVEELADRLHGLLPHLDRFYFLNSGSEAIEVGIKLLSEYWSLRGQGHRNLLIARSGSYHGSTIGALSATGLTTLREPFSSLLIESAFLSDPEPKEGESEDRATARLVAELRQTVSDVGQERILAIVAEPVQLWGARVPPAGYWDGVRAVCDEFGLPLLVDEVITGFGRTGKWFGMEQWGVEGDVVALGKGIASGYAPISAVGIREEIASVFDAEGVIFHHISTTSGHPVSSALALKNIELIERDDLVRSSAESGDRVRALLRDAFGSLPFVAGVRGIGQLNSVLFDPDRVPSGFEAMARLRRVCFEEGAYLRADGQLWIIPPLVSTEPQLEELVRIALRAVERWLAEERRT